MGRTMLNFQALWTISLVLVAQHFLFTSASSIGITLGLNGDNLPSPSDVVNFYKSHNIPAIRLYEPNHDMLNALRGSGIRVAISPRNDEVHNLSYQADAAYDWMKANFFPFKDTVDFGWIIVGNEVTGDLPGDLPDAMNYFWSVITGYRLNRTLVSTAVNTNVLGTSYPPSAGAFSNEADQKMHEIINWLTYTSNPLVVNVHPYKIIASDPAARIGLDYALFRPAQPVKDGNLTYNSLFEGTIDAFYSAMEKTYPDKKAGIIVGETGWPTAGSTRYTSVENARVYNQNLINFVKANKGTPKRPTDIMDEVFIFNMFNEDLKPGAVEQHWGLYNPDMSPVYPLKF